MKKLFVSLSVLALLATACKKDKDDETKTVTPTKENLTGSYKIVKIEASQGSQTQDVTSQVYTACDLDDIHKLNADLTYQIVDAGQSCGNDDSDTWELVNATTINIYGSSYTIDKFDGDKLQLSKSVSATAKFIETWDKQ